MKWSLQEVSVGIQFQIILLDGTHNELFEKSFLVILGVYTNFRFWLSNSEGTPNQFGNAIPNNFSVEVACCALVVVCLLGFVCVSPDSNK